MTGINKTFPITLKQCSARCGYDYRFEPLCFCCLQIFLSNSKLAIACSSIACDMKSKTGHSASIVAILISRSEACQASVLGQLLPLNSFESKLRPSVQEETKDWLIRRVLSAPWFFHSTEILLKSDAFPLFVCEEALLLTRNITYITCITLFHSFKRWGNKQE